MASRIVAPEARKDLRRIKRDHSLAKSANILGRIKHSFTLLGLYPFLGRARDVDLGPGLRSLPSDGHIIVHRATPQTATILRVIDGRRDYPSLFQP